MLSHNDHALSARALHERNPVSGSKADASSDSIDAGTSSAAIPPQIADLRFGDSTETF